MSVVIALFLLVACQKQTKQKSILQKQSLATKKRPNNALEKNLDNSIKQLKANVTRLKKKSS